MKFSRNTCVLFVLLLCLFVDFIYPQYKNVRINKKGDNDFPNEPTIVVNPVNQKNIVAGANLNNVYYSFDGGLTWSRKSLSSQYGVFGDPCVIFDTLGNLYYGHLSSSPSPGFWLDRIVVQKSTDGGVTFNTGSGIGYNPQKRNQDKEWLAADMTLSKFRNNIYTAWTEFDKYGSASITDSSRILFSRSTDLGNTWSTPVRISDVGGDCVDEDNTVEGAVPAIGPNGEVYISWAGPKGILFDKSIDGGLTFGQDIYAADQPGGWDFDIDGIYRCNGMPVTCCDVSNSRYRGNIYINWSDQRNGPKNTDVFFIKSNDGGKTWSKIIRVNNDNSGRDQFFNWMSVDPVTGYIYIIFYDRRNTTGIATDVYMARSVDGGDTFYNFKINETSFYPVKTNFFGDYNNISVFNGKIAPIWAQQENDGLNIYTAIINEGALDVESSTKINMFKAEGNLLKWSTTSEKNNKGFEIHRKDQDRFMTIGFVEGKGNSTVLNNYSFTDVSSDKKVNTYRLKQIDFNGLFNYSEEIEVDYALTKNGFVLEQNFPNPFNPSTTIMWKQSADGKVKLKIYNLLGKEIAVLVNGEKKAGLNSVTFNASNMTSGVYFYRLEAAGYTEMKQMMLIK